MDRFVKVEFKNYKALKNFSLTLTDLNIMVGPNNAGKSTIIGAFKILSEGIKRARSRTPEHLYFKDGGVFGYTVPLSNIPVASENILTNYDTREPAEIKFSLSSGNSLKLIFPEDNVCYLQCIAGFKKITSSNEFKRNFNIKIGFVPILGPIEHDESLYQEDAARNALLSHKASRNFRNIWHHYPEDFEKFQDLVSSTWPGMEIQRPEFDSEDPKHTLHMFCTEERITRELYWTGFGFQVWCQMLTFIIKSQDASLLLIDEPDIYLHSDLQRQLVDLLRAIASDVIIATHSTEIISEAEPGDLVVIDKKEKSAKRIIKVEQATQLLKELGSNFNPALTQLAKTRRVLFVVNLDFKLLAHIARKIGYQSLANRSDFTVFPIQSYDLNKIKNITEGIESTIGSRILKAIIINRDFRTTQEMKQLRSATDPDFMFTVFLEKEEMENYILSPTLVHKAILTKLKQMDVTIPNGTLSIQVIEKLIDDNCEKLKAQTCQQFINKATVFINKLQHNLVDAAVKRMVLKEFDKIWSTFEGKLVLTSGKTICDSVYSELSTRFNVTISERVILNEVKRNCIDSELIGLIEQIENFRTGKVPV